MNILFKPLAAWPRAFTKTRRGGNFSASYRDTIARLEYEIGKLGGRGVIVQTAMDESDIRLDGWPRANARLPSHPGLLVSFESRQGPLSFACDEFFEWRDNLRGIALTLERLRLVDLYGVTKSGEQYTGWKALPQAGAEGEFTDKRAALTWMMNQAAHTGVVSDMATMREIYRKAARRLHPDAGGDAAMFRQLQRAKEMLEI